MTATEAKKSSTEEQADEGIKISLIPVPLKTRLLCLVGFLVGCVFLCYLALDGSIAVRTNGVHYVTLDKPGFYSAFFSGDLRDPYGWSHHFGWHRDAFVVDLQSADDRIHVTKILPFTDISGYRLMAVAAFEVYHPGLYLVTATWNKDSDRCDGYLVLERNVVEKFAIRCATGIFMAFCLLIGIGVPFGRAKKTF